MDPITIPSSPTDLHLSLHPEPLNSWVLLEAWQECWASSPAAIPAPQRPAATALFLGRVRHTTAGGEPLEALELEHYPGMTEAQLERLAQTCSARHGALAVRVAHRVGRVLPGEVIVLVAVAADRRGPAQRCCQELLEALKHEAPFWKREWSGGRGTWVRGNTPLGEGEGEGAGGGAGEKG